MKIGQAYEAKDMSRRKAFINKSNTLTHEKSIIEEIEEKEKKTLGKRDGQPFEERLEELFDKPSSVLMRMQTFFPFDLFPDKITIDPIKITIEKNIFFSSTQITNILIKDILEVKTETAVFLATLKIIEGHNKDHPIIIKPLKKNDAIKAGKIIAGLVIGRSESAEIGKVEAIR